jgi:hypothetical protein
MKRLKTTLFIVAALAMPMSASAQDDTLESGLSRILQGLEWGSSHDIVLAYYRQDYLEDYRSDIAGLRDPLRIDEIRRHHDARYERVADSYQVFDSNRTGYEVSVLGDEVVAGNAESMITVRTDNAQLYYVFATDRLFKIAVAYNSNYIGGLQFEAFLDQVERRYGPPQASEVEERSTGARYLARARWEDGVTRLRVENRSHLFNTFIMVFSEPVLEDRNNNLRGSQTRETSSVDVSALIRDIQSGTGSATSADIADTIIGVPTEVNLTVPTAEGADVTAPADAQPDAAAALLEAQEAEEAAAAEAEAAELAEEEAAAARERRRRRREAEAAEEAAEEEGITIY